MALSEEDRQHAIDLLEINEDTLRIRDKQIERFGDETAPYIVLDAERIRAKIVILKAILEPEIPDELSGLVKRRLEDDYFIFQQTLGAKQDVALLREDVAAVKEAQSQAATDRMQTNDRLERIEGQVNTSENARKRGAWWYRRAIVITLCMAVLALIVACAALSMVSR